MHGDWMKHSMSRWRQLRDDRISKKQFDPYEHGHWIVAYWLLGDFRMQDLSEFKGTLEHVQRWSGAIIPPWWHVYDCEPYELNGVLECSLVDWANGDPEKSQFWRASPEWKLFLLRAYEDDSRPSKIAPGTVFDPTIPVLRVAECMLHAARLARALGDPSACLVLGVTWTGLSGRTLAPWANASRSLPPGMHSCEDSVSSKCEACASRVNEDLVDKVHTLTKPLYEVFGFAESEKMIQKHLSEMRSTHSDLFDTT